jgi:hypothetical protein
MRKAVDGKMPVQRCMWSVWERPETAHEEAKGFSNGRTAVA